MAMEAVPDSQTLHIPKLRRRWQVLLLQLISTASLLMVMKRMNVVFGSCTEEFIEDSGGIESTYWCPAYEHTRGLNYWQSSGSVELILPDFLHGLTDFAGEPLTGDATFVGPLALCIAVTVAWVFLLHQSEKIQTWVNRAVSIGFVAWMLLPFLMSWIYAMVINGPHVPWHPAANHLDLLWTPFMFIFEMVFLGIVFAPVLAGLMGIWGLSRRMITWAVGYFLMVGGIHAMLTFEGITEAVDVGLQPLPAQIGDATLYGGLVSPLALVLLQIALLILVFMESGLAVITHLEYASMLPEDAKRNPEYVTQFRNVINSHIVHLVGIMTVVGLTTAIALEFDDFLISLVGFLEQGQWSGQVRESLELQLTYGKVISAGLFLLVVAGMRFVLPWQRVTGIIETGMSRFRSTD
jgi:hypothetical protein